jgi:pyruvate,water dikinase
MAQSLEGLIGPYVCGSQDPASVVWLGDPASLDRTLVGGKVAHLGRLAASYCIPPGFCLTTATFDQAITRGWRMDGAAGPDLPAPLKQDLAATYQALAEQCGVDDPPVAVRSSAVDEDSAQASFAGQYASYLHVRGLDAIAQAVAGCWASALAPHVLAYRRRQGLNGGWPRLAVFVQQLVLADVSAVVFSAHPVSGDREEIVVTASWGLGESIVGGSVTPDTYVLRKADLALVTRRLAEKACMTVAVPGGTREVAVPRLMRGQPALSDEQAIEMARLALALEAAMGWPVDVECAYQGEALYLLQCRPITTLAGS